LASALEKIDYYAHHRTMPQASQATEHMYIINPLAGKDISFASLFSTHPATADRIARLKEQAAHMA
jgi:heat shock protein HtpX